MPTKKPVEGSGPWWVEDSKTHHKFATYALNDDLTVLEGESPFDRNGALRSAEPHQADAGKKGESL